jgi:hypothetical protein
MIAPNRPLRPYHHDEQIKGAILQRREQDPKYNNMCLRLASLHTGCKCVLSEKVYCTKPNCNRLKLITLQPLSQTFCATHAPVKRELQAAMHQAQEIYDRYTHISVTMEDVLGWGWASCREEAMSFWGEIQEAVSRLHDAMMADRDLWGDEEFRTVMRLYHASERVAEILK